MTRDIAARRQRTILENLDRLESVTVEELALSLEVSRETIRRDLKVLSSDGLLSIVHGGAIRNESSEASFASRRGVNREGKERIASVAASMLGDGMTILLDSGTTTAAVARALARSDCKRLVVHTTSLENARLVSRLPGARVFLIGGEFDRNEDATSGPEALRAITRLSADLSFVSVGGVDAEGRLTDYTRAGAATRSALLHAAELGYLMADSSKFGLVLPSRISGDEGCAGLLVDQLPPDQITAKLAENGVRIVTG
ncbi:DeoR/GlpR family DNA-binding transcription regulator [Bosea sp. 685]|uniref:DeoR/GlpR family DNA-binding transcription regulator n=1 Tax=Bosea sp. 685 TaxID=3080057 RepID=UPI0028935E11|nr:DeoR/GlpR family DNA-binding transcription regulator [Bosea sp. 685]WNJ88831.1 DeoR/GlpR family DNA-binding transcription regulator [Bosea sp. 685]